MNKEYFRKRLRECLRHEKLVQGSTFLEYRALAKGVVGVKKKANCGSPEFRVYFDTHRWQVRDHESWQKAVSPKEVEGYDLGVILPCNVFPRLLHNFDDAQLNAQGILKLRNDPTWYYPYHESRRTL